MSRKVDYRGNSNLPYNYQREGIAKGPETRVSERCWPSQKDAFHSIKENKLVESSGGDCSHKEYHIKQDNRAESH